MASPGRKRKPSVQTSHALELAHYRRELAAQKRSYDELYRETERLRGALDGKDAEGLRIKNKALERKRELELAQRTIEGLRNEIRAAESQAKAAREYSRNIERKVAGGSYPKILAEKNERLKQKLMGTQQDVRTKAEDLNARTCELEQARSEIAVLMRALEVRVSELGLEGENFNENDFVRAGREKELSGRHSNGRVAELRAGLLYELASKKQEAHGLGLEVANLTDALTQLREDHGALASRCDVAEASRRVAEERAEGLNRQLTQDTQQLASLRLELSNMEKERQATLRFVEELSDKNMRLESIAREAAAERVDIEARLSEELKAKKKAVIELNRSVESLRTRSNQSSAVTEMAQTRLASERHKAAQANSLLEHERLRVKALDDAVANAGRELEALRLRDGDAQRRIDQAKSEASAALSVQREAQRSLDDERSAAAVLRGEMERLLADYKQLKEDFTRTRNALTQAEVKANDGQTGAVVATTALNELRSECSRLTHSKQMLQKAMLEQLSCARRELRQEQGLRRAADAENSSLRTKLRDANMENAAIEAAVNTISEVEGVSPRSRPPSSISMSPSRTAAMAATAVVNANNEQSPSTRLDAARSTFASIDSQRNSLPPPLPLSSSTTAELPTSSYSEAYYASYCLTEAQPDVDTRRDTSVNAEVSLSDAQAAEGAEKTNVEDHNLQPKAGLSLESLAAI